MQDEYDRIEALVNKGSDKYTEKHLDHLDDLLNGDAGPQAVEEMVEEEVRLAQAHAEVREDPNRQALFQQTIQEADDVSILEDLLKSDQSKAMMSEETLQT